MHRIEWWKRQGRIEHRAEDKMRRTLRRTSVEDFGRWYHAREVERAERREAKLAARRAASATHGPPEPVGYVTTQEAAAQTGVSEKTVLRRAKQLGAVQVGRRWWVPIEAVEAIVRQLRDEAAATAADAERWVSLREAARIIGCDDSTVLTYVKRGAIERRDAPRNQPSLSRSSVDGFAAGWRARR